MKDRAQIIAENPLEREFERRGARLKKVPGQASFLTNACPVATEHKPAHLCVSLNGDVWHCHDCARGGSVIDAVMLWEGIEVKAAMARLAGPEWDAPAPPPASSQKPRIAAIYDYPDERGELLYQVCRMEPKTFRQRHKVNGEWVWNMEGVRRVLYRLPEVLKADFVWIVEGEKDANTLAGLGICATCNVGGAGKWDDSYTEALKDKDIVLCGDNDDAGHKHIDKVMASLGGKVRTTRRIRVPEQYKDVSAWLAECTVGADGLANLAESAEVLTRGIRLPIKSIAELERDYERYTVNAPLVSLRLSDWLPSTTAAIRPLVPGEMVSILAGTGIGKTMILQNIALNTRIQTLMFELELPGTLSFERFVAGATSQGGEEVYRTYHERRRVDWRATGALDHIHVCSESKLSTVELERIINNAGLKTGMRPALVLLDYIQLIQGKGDRRERISDAAEELKIIAKATNTIVVCASQVARKKGDEDGEVSLCDAKESGSIENSSGLVLGVWKESRTRMIIKVLKNTKGMAGKTVACDIKPGLVIKEAPTHEQPQEATAPPDPNYHPGRSKQTRNGNHED